MTLFMVTFILIFPIVAAIYGMFLWRKNYINIWYWYDWPISYFISWLICYMFFGAVLVFMYPILYLITEYQK